MSNFPTKSILLFLLSLISFQSMAQTKPNIWLSNSYKSTVNRYRTVSTKTAIISNSANPKYNKITINKGGKDTSLPASQQVLTTRTSTSSPSCYTYKNTVKENRDFLTIPVFNDFRTNIYPGYIVNQTSVLNNSFPANSLPIGVSNRSYTISANVYGVCSSGSSTNANCNTKQIGTDNNFGFAAYNAKLNEIVNTFPTEPSTLPLQEMRCEFMEFNTKEELSMKLGYGLSASLPPEVTAMLSVALGAPPIPAAVNVDISANASASTIIDKKRIMMKLGVTYFDVVADPQPSATNNTLSPLNLINVATGTSTPTDLLFVRSVSYGSEGYILFEADMSTTELNAAISEALSVSGSGPIDQAKIGVSMSAETKNKFTSGKIRMAGYGRGISIDQPRLITNLDDLKTILATVKGCSKTNYGVPIAYQMNFISQLGEQAVKNHTLDYTYQICSKPIATEMLYDLELQLTGIDVKKVGDIGGAESLYGQIDFTWFCGASGATDGSCPVPPGVSSGSDVNLWNMLEGNSNNAPFRESTSRQSLGNKRIIVKTGLKYDQLVNGSIYVQAQLKDDEGLLGSRTFKCMNCDVGPYAYTNAKNTGQTDNFYKRMIFFINSSAVIKNAVNGSIPGTYFTIPFNGGNEITMRMCESGNCNDGESVLYFKLFAIPR